MQPVEHRAEEAPVLIGGRYRVEATLGEGGMATVYRVVDGSTDRTLALKQLRPGDGDSESVSQLFEQEFHTLIQLAHPRIVRVFDYVKDPAAPFYTMELLDGGDLRELSPLPWQRVCALFCDVCSALSLLHSRRLVHRDLTPRNIRCTTDGAAKLIDFGAMARVGPSKQVVGTPAFVAPEALNGQIVDARTDLFALGAALYYTLTRRHAYPARTLAEARHAWRARPTPLSRYVEGIPKELNELVMALLQLSPVARPGSAAEVMDRLSAIAGLELDEQLFVREAYLRTPALVGRDESVAKVHKQVLRALQGRGGATLITGQPGVGRSRFLDACILEGKLAGATALRTDPSDCSAGDWGAAVVLARQLVDALPEVAHRAARPHAAILGHILPELVGTLKTHGTGAAENGLAENDGAENDGARNAPALQAFDTPQERRARLLDALRQWMLSVSEEACLLVAADDLHRLDEPSAALLALLAHESRGKKLIVFATTETDATLPSEEAVSFFLETGAALKLRPLTFEQTEQLLQSVFGDVRNVRLLADRLHGVSGGYPQAILQLAQHLLDQRIIEYTAGVWTLPSQFDPGDLPETLGDALKARLGSLKASTLELSRGMALSEKEGWSFDECLALTAHHQASRLVGELDELAAAEIVITDGSRYRLSHPSWRSMLVDGLEEARERELRLRLARLLESQPVEQKFRLAHHLWKAGEQERALDALLEYVEKAAEARAKGLEEYFEFIRTLPSDWAETCEALLGVCEALGRPAAQRFALRYALVSFGTVTAGSPVEHLRAVTDDLYRYSGLAAYHELDESMEAGPRLGQALGTARQQFDALLEADQVISPADAIQRLAQMTIRAIGLSGRALDYGLLESMPSLEPFSALSPAVALVDLNRRSTLNVLAGRSELGRQGYLQIIERMDQPDGGGLQGSDHTNMRFAIMWALGTVEIQTGRREGLRWADAIQDHPFFEVNAWRLRLLDALRYSEAERAADCKRKLELLRIQNRPPQMFEGSYLATLSLAYATCNDLAGLKEILPGLEEMARNFEGWVPCLHFARGMVQSLRGNLDRAAEELGEALALVEPGRHIMWAPIAGYYLSTLAQTGRAAEAHELGQEMFRSARSAGIETLIVYLRQGVALVEASLGRFDEAIEYAESGIDYLESLGAAGNGLGALFEVRARVAISMKDEPAFRAYADKCAAEYRAGEHPTLTAKYERLMHDARQAGLDVSGGSVAVDRTASPPEEDMSSRIGTLLGTCQGPRERAERALAVLLQSGNLASGFLYTVQPGGLVLAAYEGAAQPPAGLDTAAGEYLEKELDELDGRTRAAGTVLATSADADPNTGYRWTTADGEIFYPVLLAHGTDEGYVVTGVVMLPMGSEGTWEPRYGVLAAVSRSLFDAGDVQTVVLAE